MRGKGLSAAAAAAPTASVRGRVPVGGEELVDRELHMPEQLAGILVAGAAVAGALLLGHAVIVDRDQQLGIPLQANERELAQGYIETLTFAGEVQIAAEAGADTGGHIGELTAAAAVAGAMAVAGIHQLHAQDQGVYRLH